jgi:hypothetical protein
MLMINRDEGLGTLNNVCSNKKTIRAVNQIDHFTYQTETTLCPICHSRLRTLLKISFFSIPSRIDVRRFQKAEDLTIDPKIPDSNSHPTVVSDEN